ncbi:MAG TPA: hypothetical protein VG710_08445 [Opitutus sp.]|nr:hypothetical protein [Polyangiaceae bacterium]HWA86235.1 hypothetical protein [Opitutus sp.]
MFGVALVAAAGTVAVAVCARAWFRQRLLSPGDVAALESVFRGADDAKVEAAVRRAFPDAADAMLRGRTSDTEEVRLAGAAALDECLGDLDGELAAHEGIAPGAIRVALLSAGLGAIVELAGDFERLPAALCAAVLGVGAAAVCFELGRNMTRRATELRRDWDRVAGSAAARLGLVDTAASAAGAPGRRGDRDQRRSRRRGS